MRFDSDTLGEIVSTLTRNRTRSLLTAFGVFWGVFMLLVLLGGGKALKTMMGQNFDGFATNSGMAVTDRTGLPYKGFRKDRRWDMELDDIERIRQFVPGVDVVTASSANWGGSAVYGEKKYEEAVIKGLTPEYAAVETQQLSYGRFINPTDMREGRKVCVIGKRVYEKLFRPGENPCGYSIAVGGVYFKVVGVAVQSGDMSIQGSAQESIVIPLSVFQAIYNKGKRFDILCYTGKPGYRISQLEPKVKEVLYMAHFIAPDDPKAIWQLNAEDMFSMLDNLFVGINILIFLVGAGTLLAGVIGVSNIMMVTVRERTVEIGIRRAIGALPGDIMGQILAESVLLTVVAGLAGVTFAVLVLQGVDSLVLDDNGNPYGFQASFSTAMSTAGFLLALGLVAGLAPAYRAMAIKPVEAMREE